MSICGAFFEPLGALVGPAVGWAGTAGFGVGFGFGVAVGGTGVGVSVGGTGVGVAVGDGVGVVVGVGGTSVAVGSTGVAVKVGAGVRLGTGVGSSGLLANRARAGLDRLQARLARAKMTTRPITIFICRGFMVIDTRFF